MFPFLGTFLTDLAMQDYLEARQPAGRTAGPGSQGLGGESCLLSPEVRVPDRPLSCWGFMLLLGRTKWRHHVNLMSWFLELPHSKAAQVGLSLSFRRCPHWGERCGVPPSQETHKWPGSHFLPETFASLSVIRVGCAGSSLSFNSHLPPSLGPRAWPRSLSCYLCMPCPLEGPGSSAS